MHDVRDTYGRTMSGIPSQGCHHSIPQQHWRDWAAETHLLAPNTSLSRDFIHLAILVEVGRRGIWYKRAPSGIRYDTLAQRSLRDCGLDVRHLVRAGTMVQSAYCKCTNCVLITGRSALTLLLS
jgi:hypothetical protein